jgi:predicted AAA+ superfamily ATPase
MFALDTGLLGALSGLDARTLINGSEMFTEFKGSLTEQYVCQQLIMQGITPYYWAKPNSQAEVDFVVTIDGNATPIEVKAETNLKAKSLKNAALAFDIDRSVRTGLAGFRDEGWLVNIPLWAIGAIDAILSTS